MESAMPCKYSFVLPAYKGKRLGQAINSILSQTFSSFELIVVDDCSPDNLFEVVNSFVDDRIKYFKNEKNIGGHDLVKQWNYSISKASGEYLVLASDDDIYEPVYLEKMNYLVENYPQASVYRPLICHIDDNNEVIISEQIDSDQPYLITLNEYLSLFSTGKLLSGLQQYLFKRVDLIEAGGFVDFPLAWFSDDATVMKLAKNGGIAVYPEILFKFRIWEESISGESFKRMSVMKKIDAARSFSDFLDNEVTPDPSVLSRIQYRCQYLTVQLFSKASLWEMLRGLLYMSRAHSSIFPMKRMFLLFCSCLKRRFIYK